MMDPRAIGVIWKRELIRVSRDKTQLAGAVARPVLWLVVMGWGMGSVFSGFGGMRYLDYLFPGIVAMNLLFASFLSTVSIIWDREFGFLKEMLVAPISRLSIALGKAAAGATIACLQGCIVISLVPLLEISVRPWGLLLAFPLMFAIAFPLTSLGLLIASRMTSFEGFGVISNFVIMPMFFLSGALFPLDKVPPLLKAFSAVNPLTYGVDLLRWAFQAGPTHPLWLSAAALALFTAASVGGAVWAFCRRS